MINLFKIKLNIKKKLNRNEFINTVDSNKIWCKLLNDEEVLTLLNQLKEKITTHDFKFDNNFIMNGRRTCLRNMIFERVENSTNEKKKIITDSLFNLWEFVNDEYDGNLIEISKKLNCPLRKIISKCNKYRKKNIICLQEKDLILEMIKKIEDYIIYNSKISDL